MAIWHTETTTEDHKRNEESVHTENRNIKMWRHIKTDLEAALWRLRCAGKGILAAIFGRVTHDGWAITFRGTSYRIKQFRDTP